MGLFDRFKPAEEQILDAAHAYGQARGRGNLGAMHEAEHKYQRACERAGIEAKDMGGANERISRKLHGE